MQSSLCMDLHLKTFYLYKYIQNQHIIKSQKPFLRVIFIYSQGEGVSCPHNESPAEEVFWFVLKIISWVSSIGNDSSYTAKYSMWRLCCQAELSSAITEILVPVSRLSSASQQHHIAGFNITLLTSSHNPASVPLYIQPKLRQHCLHSSVGKIEATFFNSHDLLFFPTYNPRLFVILRCCWTTELI